MTTLTQDPDPRLEEVGSETYCCPLCSGRIAPQCVHGKLEVDDTGHTLRQMGIYCDHCSAVFRIKLRIEPISGGLVPAGKWQRVTAAKERAEFLSKCDAARFNIQLGKPRTGNRQLATGNSPPRAA